MGSKNPERRAIKCSLPLKADDVFTHANFCQDWSKCFSVARDRILAFFWLASSPLKHSRTTVRVCDYKTGDIIGTTQNAISRKNCWRWAKNNSNVLGSKNKNTLYIIRTCYIGVPKAAGFLSMTMTKEQTVRRWNELSSVATALAAGE